VEVNLFGIIGINGINRDTSHFFLIGGVKSGRRI